MTRTLTRRDTLTPSLLIGAAVLVNVAFAGLGAVFDYPAVLSHPPADALAAFRADQVTVSAWFLALALGAALMAPIAVRIGRSAAGPVMRWAVGVGIAAAVVQVVGLLRWPLLVPGWAASGDVESFRTANWILGSLVGETCGYLLTAAWTVLVLVALRGRFGRWFDVLGAASAVLVFVGVLVPLGLPLVDTANFVGYILWSAWLVIFGVVLLVKR
jgi:hypothetical protein